MYAYSPCFVYILLDFRMIYIHFLFDKLYRSTYSDMHIRHDWLTTIMIYKPSATYDLMVHHIRNTTERHFYSWKDRFFYYKYNYLHDCGSGHYEWEYQICVDIWILIMKNHYLLFWEEFNFYRFVIFDENSTCPCYFSFYWCKTFIKLVSQLFDIWANSCKSRPNMLNRRFQIELILWYMIGQRLLRITMEDFWKNIDTFTFHSISTKGARKYHL